MFFESLPKNKEIGSAMCRARNGRILPGKFASGNLESVDVDLTTCPPNTILDGVWHTHPMGLAQPSKEDYDQARHFGIKKLCITATRPNQADETRCFRVK
jgi:proteasome lid subunit RPN8/RPN11